MNSKALLILFIKRILRYSILILCNISMLLLYPAVWVYDQFIGISDKLR